MSLSEQARTGLREMPSNAAWLLSRVLKPAEAVGTAAESATAGARDRGRKVKAAVVDATPFGGDSVDIRMRRAHDAGERAREAEERAARGRPGIEGALRARSGGRRARSRTLEGGRPGDEPDGQAADRRRPEGRRGTRRARAPRCRGGCRGATPTGPSGGRPRECRQLRRDAEDVPSARRGADRGRDRETRGGRAARRRGRGSRSYRRRGSQPPGAVTGERSPAAGTRRRSAGQGDRAAPRADAHDRQAHRARTRVATNGGLESHSKAELVQLAASVGIESRTNMTKSELVDAIAKASRTER